jgi:hypothetical protein
MGQLLGHLHTKSAYSYVDDICNRYVYKWNVHKWGKQLYLNSGKTNIEALALEQIITEGRVLSSEM